MRENVFAFPEVLVEGEVSGSHWRNPRRCGSSKSMETLGPSPGIGILLGKCQGVYLVLLLTNNFIIKRKKQEKKRRRENVGGWVHESLDGVSKKTRCEQALSGHHIGQVDKMAQSRSMQAVGTVCWVTLIAALGHLPWAPREAEVTGKCPQGPPTFTFPNPSPSSSSGGFLQGLAPGHRGHIILSSKL